MTTEGLRKTRKRLRQGHPLQDFPNSLININKRFSASSKLAIQLWAEEAEILQIARTIELNRLLQTEPEPKFLYLYSLETAPPEPDLEKIESIKNESTH